MPHANYAVMPGGDRFVVFGGGATAEPEAIVVLSWLAELRPALAAARDSAARR